MRAFLAGKIYGVKITQMGNFGETGNANFGKMGKTRKMGKCLPGAPAFHPANVYKPKIRKKYR